MLDHINKIKALANQLVYLEISVRNKDVVLTLLPLYEHFIIVLEMKPMKKLTIQYVTVHLMHKMLKRKEKEPQGDEITMVLH